MQELAREPDDRRAGASVAGIVLGCYVVGHIRDRLTNAERRIYLYAWHLREFVPPSARGRTDPTS